MPHYSKLALRRIFYSLLTCCLVTMTTGWLLTPFVMSPNGWACRPPCNAPMLKFCSVSLVVVTVLILMTQALLLLKLLSGKDEE